MKVPLSWLRRFVAIDDLSLDELLDVLSLHGLEVEEVVFPGRGTHGVRTKQVTHWEPHPNADKLRLVRVTDGDQETELVCGAWNFEVGDVVAHAEVGATIPPPPGSTDPMRLEARELRGVVSNGMLCSAAELDLGDDHSGIVVLPPDTPVGQDLTDLLPVGEPVIDIAVLADRGDHHSLLGVARELAAILGRDLAVPDIPSLPEPTAAVGIDIQAKDGCRHFVTRVVEGVEVGPSPWWLRQRLAQCGIRAINNVVDVTNYVMLELGQPLHAFDLDAIAGPELHVRWAGDDETLVTLDDKERRLRPSDLVIADAEGPVSLAAVMGGAHSEVSEGTTRVLVEGAIWDPLTIRRTSRRLNLVSEASLRFERRVDPAGAGRAVARAVQLLEQVAGGTAGPVSADGAPGDRPDAVDFDPAWCARLLGAPDLPAEAQVAILGRLGCETEEDGDGFRVRPPTWRGDLARPADLAEEVARLHGYERIPATLPVVSQRGGRSPAQRAERRLRDAALAAGLHEVRTRPFTGAQALEGVVPSEGRVRLENPLAKDASAMAPTLVEGLLQVVRRNVGQGRPGTAVFEVARIFRPQGDPIEDALKAFGDGWLWRDAEGRALPTQPRTVALAAQGVRTGTGWLDNDTDWSVYDLLAVLDEMVERVAPADRTDWRLVRRSCEREGFHPGRTAALDLRGAEVGVVGQLHPDEIEARDLVEPVVVAELLLEPLLAHLEEDEGPLVQARPLVTHPALTIDVALVAEDDVSYDDLVAAVRAGAGDLLDELWFFDEYRGEQLGEGRRSVAIKLRLQDPHRQLTDDDAQAVITAVGREAELVGAALRG